MADTRVILVQRFLQGEKLRLGELKSLAEAADYTVVGAVNQRRKVDSKYQIGEGKVKELADLVKDKDAEKIIFYNDLKPIQAYNIAKITRVEIIDRFQLILEIFTKRAATKEAQLQIQLAGLRYQIPRARESIRLARMGEQPGFLGLGRYEIDVYLESMRRRIAHIRKELRDIRTKRNLQRTRRMDHGFSLISMAGYTYAGKTTLFNALTKESKPVNQGLFTTLSTTTRAVDFPDRKVLFTDTVGFVDQLPIVLIEAFRSTLEETALSEAIVLVVDFNEPVDEISRKITCCIDTLNEIGAYGVPLITALNKIDLMSEEEIANKLPSIRELVQNPVLISAIKDTNLKELKQKVVECLESLMQASFIIPISSKAESFISSLYEHAKIDTHYKGKEIRVTLKTSPLRVEMIRGKLEKLGGRMLDNSLVL